MIPLVGGDHLTGRAAQKCSTGEERGFFEVRFYARNNNMRGVEWALEIRSSIHSEQHIVKDYRLSVWALGNDLGNQSGMESFRASV